MPRGYATKLRKGGGCEFGEDFDYDVDFLNEEEQEELEDIIKSFRKEVREAHKERVDYRDKVIAASQLRLKNILTDGRGELTPSEVKALIEISTGLSMEVTEEVNLNDLLGVSVPEGMEPITMGFCHKSLRSDMEELLEAIDDKLERFLGTAEDTEK
jgi:hypothetical protein